jgi:hypothetical protein
MGKRDKNINKNIKAKNPALMLVKHFGIKEFIPTEKKKHL